MDFKADLHCHSTCSDGTLAPLQLIMLAKEKKINALSITDHDTIDAYNEELFHFAKKVEIELLTGVEISAIYKNETVHILGYNFDYESKNLINFLAEIQIKRKGRNLEILQKLKKHQIFIDEELISKSSSIGRPHLAKEMVKKGYVKNLQEAFDKYLKDGGPCYVAGERLSPLEIIEKLHEIKAKAVLAHPSQISNHKITLEVLNFPFDGLEVFYGFKNPQTENHLIKIAKEKKLIITGGSDYHGETKQYLPLGSRWTPKEYYDKLKT